MPATLPSHHFSAVLADYTSGATALAITGVPTLAQLPRRTHASTDALPMPHVLFAVEVDPESDDTLLTLSLKIQIVFSIGTETGQLTRATATGYLQALRTLLDDDHRGTWQTWITAQSDAYRTGWHIESMFPQPITEDPAEDKATLTLTAPYTMAAYWNNA